MKIYIDKIINSGFSKEVFMVLPVAKRKLKVGDQFHISSVSLTVIRVNPRRVGLYTATAVPTPKHRKTDLTAKVHKR